MSDRLLAPAKIEYEDSYVLRPVETKDVLVIERALQSSLHDLRAYMAWAHHLQNHQQFLERIATQLLNYVRGDEYEMALFDKKSGEFLVYSGFYPTARINPNCFEIGFWTSSEHKNKGFATLATQMQILLIFEYLKGDRVEITCNLDNKASLRVIEKCGFQFEGNLRHFYPKGSEQMFLQGYTRQRSVSLFSLIPDDCQNLSWYTSLLKKLIVFPYFDAPLKLIRK